MRKKIILLISAFLLLKAILIGQCPDRNTFLQQIIYISDTSKLTLSAKTSQLLDMLKNINACPYRNDSIHAILLKSIGALYYGQNDFLNAVKYYNRCIDLIHANYNSPAIDRRPLLGCYIWLYSFYKKLGNRSKEMEAVDNCIEAARELNSYSDISCVEALAFKTENYFDLGDYHNCIIYAAMCEKFSWECAEDNKNNKDKTYLATAIQCALNSLGWHIETLLKLNDYKAASVLLNESLEKYKTRETKIYNGMIYDQLAQVEIDKKDYNKALIFLNESLKSEESVGNYFNYKQELNRIAYDIYFNHYNDNNKALEYYRKALSYSYRNKTILQKDSMESLHIYDRMAMVYVKERLFDSAFKYFQTAFNQIRPGITEADILNFSKAKIEELKKIDYLVTLLIDKGNAYEKKYLVTSKPQSLSEAIRIYKMADQFLDIVKNESDDLQSKLFWRNSPQSLYEHAINACYLQNNIADAFYFFEKSRAVLLNDELNKQRWLGENDIMKETQVERKILDIQQSLNSTDRSSKKYSQLEDDLFNSRQELHRLQELVKTANPLYYQSFFEKKFVTISDVKNIILKDHKALIELFNGDSAVYMIIITSQKSYLQKINKITFDSLSFAFTNYISNYDLLNKEFNNYVSLSQQFYQLLFRSINLPFGRIIISPGGKYFPFEALVTSTKPINYFLDDHAVSYTYSARYLLSNFTTSSSDDQNFLGVAPLKFANLASLTGSDASLIKVQSYFSHATNYIGRDASKNNFMSEFYKYKIIQLYTHATDSGYAGEPIIYFSDSSLRLSELLPEKKPVTDLIVLSACQTGTGTLYSGEGVFSFSRSFAALGIPSSISNLWEIDKRSTYTITELFYKYLSKGLPLDVALQKAKIEFKNSGDENKLPYYWAAPILVGKTDAISQIKKGKWQWIVAIDFFIIFFAVAWAVKGNYITRKNQKLPFQEALTP